MSSDRAPSKSGVRSKALSSSNRSPRQGSSSLYHGNKDLSPRISLDLQTGNQTHLNRSPSPQIHGRVTPLCLDRGSPSDQLERGPSGLDGKSNKPRLPPVSPSIKKKSSKQVSPRQKSGTRALVPKSTGAIASLKAAKEALPIVKKDGMYFPKGQCIASVCQGGGERQCWRWKLII